jgi:Zn-dependent protease with chaperone function
MLAVGILIAALVLSQMAMYEAHLLWGANMHRNLLDYCAGLFYRSSFLYYAIHIALNALVIYTLFRLIHTGLRQIVLDRTYGNRLSRLSAKHGADRLAVRFGYGANDLVVLQDERMVALTAGFGKPRIVLSTGLIDLLDERELQAVLAHEASHRIHRDPLKLFVLRLISDAFGYIPLTRWAYRNYSILCELTADEHAIANTGSEAGLGSAMLKMLGRARSKPLFPAAAGFADGSINYRLRQLVEPKPALPIRLDARSLAISLSVLALLLGMIVLAGT